VHHLLSTGCGLVVVFKIYDEDLSLKLILLEFSIEIG